ncbi:hypothetical protein GCM10020220_051440 [Nonomuraea rubra]
MPHSAVGSSSQGAQVIVGAVSVVFVVSALAGETDDSVAIAIKAAASRENLLRTVLQSSVDPPVGACDQDWIIA